MYPAVRVMGKASPAWLVRKFENAVNLMQTGQGEISNCSLQPNVTENWWSFSFRHFGQFGDGESNN